VFPLMLGIKLATINKVIMMKAVAFLRKMLFSIFFSPLTTPVRIYVSL